MCTLLASVSASLRDGQMVQWLRALGPAKDLGLVLSTHGSLQTLLIPVPGEYTYNAGENTHIHFFF